jgi:hypothetical protein
MVSLVFLLSACLGPAYPTQSHPVCSWDSNPPSHSDVVCKAVFQTLRDVATASVRGDSSRLRQLVTNVRARHSIATYGIAIRRKGAKGVHIVPSFTLKEMSPGYYGAGFFLLGSSRSGEIKSQDTVYVRIRGGNAVIADDQPAEDW